MIVCQQFVLFTDIGCVFCNFVYDGFYSKSYLGLKIKKVFKIFLDRVIAEECKSGVVNIATSDFLVESVEKLFDGGAPIKADDLIGTVEKMHRDGVR